MHSSSKEQLDLAVQLICARYDKVWGIYLFGTFGSEYEREDSDIDLALLLPTAMDNLERWDFSQELAQHLHREVDLVDLHNASTVFRYVIFSEGSRLFAANKEACDAFELESISRYLRFDEARREVEGSQIGDSDG